VPNLTSLPSNEQLQHYPDLSNFWKHTLPPLTPGDFDFELAVRLASGTPWLNIDALTQTIEWSEQEATPGATVTLARPEIDDPSSMPVQSGMDVRLRTRWEGSWYTLWTMRAENPQESGDGTATVALLDDLDLVRRSERDFIFRAPHHSPGYTCDEIAKMVCEKINVPHGHLVKGKRRIRRVIKPKTSALAVIAWAYGLEHARTGIRYFPRMVNGEVCVFPYRRNPILYVLGDMLTEVDNQPLGSPRPVTIITGKAHIGSGKKARHVEYTGYNEAAVKRFGAVHHDQEMGRVEDLSDLKERVKRSLASELRVAHAGTFTTPGIPFIRRGDGIELALPEFRWTGRQRFTFVAGIQHVVSPGTYTSAVTVASTDLFAQYRRALEAEQRAKKRKERGR
jgi:hypothetical protein